MVKKTECANKPARKRNARSKDKAPSTRADTKQVLHDSTHPTRYALLP